MDDRGAASSGEVTIPAATASAPLLLFDIARGERKLTVFRGRTMRLEEPNHPMGFALHRVVIEDGATLEIAGGYMLIVATKLLLGRDASIVNTAAEPILGGKGEARWTTR